MKIPERKRGKTSSRKDNYITVLILACIAAMIFRIPLGYMIGDKGLAYFGTANEICILFASVMGYGLSEATALLVRYRMKRDQMRSARKIGSVALLLSAVIGVLLSFVTAVSGYALAEKVFGLPLAGMAVAAISPSVVFLMMSGVLKGYFKGNGSLVPAMHSVILNILFLFVGGLVGASMMYGYGEKVSALLQNPDYASAYGAVGVAIGIDIASVLCFLHLFILYFMFKSKMKKQMGRELQRNQETTPRAAGMLVGTGIIYIAIYLVFGSHIPLNQYLLYQFGGIAQGVDSLWGNYYGKYLVVFVIILSICILYCMMPIKKLALLFEREDYRGAKERFGVLIHQCTVVAAPAAILLAVLSETVLDVLFEGSNAQTAHWLQIGSITLFVMIFGITFLNILLKLRRMKIVVGVGAVALLIQVISAIILLAGVKLEVTALIISQLLFWLAVTVWYFIAIGRAVKYKQEWIRSFAFPIVAAAIGGLIAMLLNKALLSLVGNIATLIICVVFGMIAYLVILLALKDFTEDELELMPGGYLLMALGRRLRLM